MLTATGELPSFIARKRGLSPSSTKTRISKLEDLRPDSDVPDLDPPTPVTPPKTEVTPPKDVDPVTPDTPNGPGNPIELDDGIPATSAIAREELRLKLAIEAGIPRTLDQVWGASLDDLVQMYRMDGAKTTPKPPSPDSSGNAQIFTVEGHPLIKEVQYSPESSISVHGGEYYKFTFLDGTKVKIIDPDNYKVQYKLNSQGVFEADLEKKTAYYNSAGQGVVYVNDKWVLK